MRVKFNLKYVNKKKKNIMTQDIYHLCIDLPALLFDSKNFFYCFS